MLSMSRRAVVTQTLQERLTRSISKDSRCSVDVRDANFKGCLVVKSSKGRNDNTRTYRYLSSQIQVITDRLNVKGSRNITCNTEPAAV